LILFFTGDVTIEVGLDILAHVTWPLTPTQTANFLTQFFSEN